jgi:hypothetical protein
MILITSSLFKRCENVHAYFAGATLIRLAEINDSRSLITTDSDFRVYHWCGK